MTVRLIVADPTPVVRVGLRTFFENADVQIVDEAQTGEATVVKTLNATPDVLLLDTQFPDRSGFDVTKRLRERQYDGRVIFFSASDRQMHFARAIAVGADSYLLKRTPQAELLRVVRGLVDSPVRSFCSSAYSSRDLARDLATRVEQLAPFSGELRRVVRLLGRRSGDHANPLTDRETQVLRHVALGLSNKEIASSLQLSLDTIKEHVQNILRKLAVSDRTQAAVWAVRNKLIP